MRIVNHPRPVRSGVAASRGPLPGVLALALALAALAVSHAPAAAQAATQAGEPGAATADRTAEESWRPGEEDRSIAFALPGGGNGQFGLWWHDPRGALGLELDFAGDAALDLGGDPADRYVTQLFAGAGLAWKRYAGPRATVSPFLYWGTGVHTYWSNAGADDPAPYSASSWRVGGYGRLGMGVDWFPLERISIGGYVGGRASYDFQPTPTDTRTEQDLYRRHAFRASLFTSALTLHIYF